MENHNKKEIILSYIDAYNNFDVEKMMETIHPEIEFLNISAGETTLNISNNANFKQQAAEACSYFQSRQQKAMNWFYGDDHVEVGIEFNAVFAKDLPNGIKEGQEIRLQGKSVFQFRDGLITRLVDFS